MQRRLQNHSWQICLKDKEYILVFRHMHAHTTSAQFCIKLTLWLLRLCRFWWWFGRLWVHLGHICLWLVLLQRSRFGLRCRIAFLSRRISFLISRVHILISVVCGLDSSRDMRHWFLMAHGPLNTLRSIWHTKDTRLLSRCNHSHLRLLGHRNPLWPVTVWLQW